VPHAARPDLLEANRKLLELETKGALTKKQQAERKALEKRLAPYRTPREKSATLLDPRTVADRNGAKR